MSTQSLLYFCPLILIFAFTLTLIYDLCSSVILSVNAVLTDTANSGPDEPAEIALLGFCGIGNNQDSITHKTQHTHRISREYLTQEDCM